MSGHKNGVQAKKLEKQPKALYTHCSGHVLNLSMVGSCVLPEIKNCIDTIKSITLWIKHSPKREGLLKAIVAKNTLLTTGRIPLLIKCLHYSMGREH